MSIIALIPTHNCPNILETIASLYTQSLRPTKIVVILDNPKDATIEEKLTLQQKSWITNDNWCGLEILKTEKNEYKKAGALNLGFIQYLGEGDFFFTMDDDTLLDTFAIERLHTSITKNPKLGAVCTRAGVMKPSQDLNAWKGLLWHIQNLEYPGFDTHRVETKGNIKVAHGMGTLYRAQSLKDVLAHRISIGQQSGVYLLGNLTEDYELTRRLIHIGWQAESTLEATAWTEVPLTLKTLYNQRLRWLRGGVDTLREMGFVRGTRADIGGHFLFLIVFLLQIIVTCGLVSFIVHGGTYSLSLPTMAIIGLYYVNNLYRMRYVNASWIDWIVRLLFIPEMAYSMFQLYVLLAAYIYSFCNIKQKW